MFLLITVPLLSAVTLSNKDGKKYNLYVDHGSSATHTSLNGNTTTTVCSQKCTIKIKGNGASIKASDGDQIVIQKGVLKKK